MTREFIEGWDLLQVLGEGTFGEVKLLANRQSGQMCAMKEINLDSDPQAEIKVKREISVHKLLSHRNIIHCFGSRLEGRRQFIFVEYCSGGELFDRIEPDNGMPEHVAQMFFKSLIDGIEYLHIKGISHRDIKPENLLLTAYDCLKISDFGMATIFRHQGVERLLERRCGTLPYIAPEVLCKSKYRAEPADIWSCGVVLVTMLTGELPWDKPTSEHADYLIWKSQELDTSPWNKMKNLPLSLIRKILKPNPARRFTLEQIKNHAWLKKEFKENMKNNGGVDSGDVEVAASGASNSNRSGSGINLKKRVCSELDLVTEQSADPPDEPAATQPVTSFFSKFCDSRTLTDTESTDLFHAFTQPAKLDNMLLLSTQLSSMVPPSQDSKSPHDKLVKRMTRFWVNTDRQSAEEELRNCLQKDGYTFRMITPGIMTVEIVDSRNMLLVFKVSLIEMNKKILLDFRRSRGCGMEFKRRFRKLKGSMDAVIVKGPDMWSPSIQ